MLVESLGEGSLVESLTRHREIFVDNIYTKKENETGSCEERGTKIKTGWSKDIKCEYGEGN